MKDWKEIYALPLELDKHADFMVWGDNKNINALDFDYNFWDDVNNMDYKTSLKIKNQIIDKINGNDNIVIEEIYNFSYDDGVISAYFAKDQQKYEVFTIRGWGHLTSPGGLHLTGNEAAKIQDDFGAYILERLNH